MSAKRDFSLEAMQLLKLRRLNREFGRLNDLLEDMDLFLL